MFGDNGQVFILNDHGSHEANGSHGSCAYGQAPPSTLRHGSHGAESVTIAVRSVETPNHICHMLPCLEVEGGNEVAWVIGAYSRRAKAIEGPA